MYKKILTHRHGSVRGEEDPAVVLLLAAGVEELVHQELQGGGLQTPHLAGSVRPRLISARRHQSVLEPVPLQNAQRGERGHRGPRSGSQIM
ncbi:hypothetical protein EYF80_048518 [Liparis tanakae]|uniref:Uncharacterized protein n=1 Tax=Liparis tanakae TaxID=230148 RepID=A0A4Z2FK26_9TELE|nr:hypothetical protein EYF80_048518 [Liparis tanakae]